jgi:hypothetical protein
MRLDELDWADIGGRRSPPGDAPSSQREPLSQAPRMSLQGQALQSDLMPIPLSAYLQKRAHNGILRRGEQPPIAPRDARNFLRKGWFWPDVGVEYSRMRACGDAMRCGTRLFAQVISRGNRRNHSSERALSPECPGGHLHVIMQNAQ